MKDEFSFQILFLTLGGISGQIPTTRCLSLVLFSREKVWVFLVLGLFSLASPSSFVFPSDTLQPLLSSIRLLPLH